MLPRAAPASVMREIHEVEGDGHVDVENVIGRCGRRGDRPGCAAGQCRAARRAGDRATTCRPTSTRTRSSTCRCSSTASTPTTTSTATRATRPKLEPWLAESHTVSRRRPHLGIQAAPRRQVPRRQRDHGRGRGLQLSARAGDRQGAGRRLPAGAEAGERHGARPADGAASCSTSHTRRSSRRCPSS